MKQQSVEQVLERRVYELEKALRRQTELTEQERRRATALEAQVRTAWRIAAGPVRAIPTTP